MLEDEFLEDDSGGEENKKSKDPRAKKRPRPRPVARGPRQVALGWTAAFVVASFLVGFLIGGVLGQPETGFQSVPSGVPSGGGDAPTLSPEQLQGEELPAGHPQLGQDETATTMADGEGGGTTPDETTATTGVEEE